MQKDWFVTLYDVEKTSWLIVNLAYIKKVELVDETATGSRAAAHVELTNAYEDENRSYSENVLHIDLESARFLVSKLLIAPSTSGGDHLRTFIGA